MLKVFKYRIYPNAEQSEQMFQFFGCTRFLYNKCLEWWQCEHSRWKTEGGEFAKLPLVTFFKKDFEFLKDCDNAALAYSRSNFERAIKDYLKSKKGQRNGKVGFPKFKKKGIARNAYRTCDAHGGIRFDESGKHIRLPKVGWVKVVKHRDFDGVIKAVAVDCSKSGRWHVSVLVECNSVEHRHHAKQFDSVGLDMSLTNFLVSSCEDDDMITKYRRNYRSEERSIKRLSKKLSRKQKGSANRNKARIRLARLHERIADRRRDFIVKTALYYARKYKHVVIEDLDMKAMSRTLHLGKSVMDLSWGEFRRWLSLQCDRYGTELVVADKWFASSKTCHHCGCKNKLLKLSDREWVCPECDSAIDRDRNAALNLRDYNTVGTTGIQACGDDASIVGLGRRQATSAKQEAAPFTER